MSNFEEENNTLREQMTSMQAEIEKLTTMMASLLANQNQTPASVPQPSSALVPPPVFSVPLNDHRLVMPGGCTWGLTEGFLGEGVRLGVSEIPYDRPIMSIPQLGNTFPHVTASVSAPVVHTIQRNQIPIFHAENMEGYDKFDDLQIKYDEMQREVKALRGKDLFGQDAQELCLVPDVVVPHKFKVPDFEKYKGSTCPKAHLIMYARKMSTQTSNDKLLIHYFQDSLTGAALRWYMDLDRANISSFNDLASAFIRQYNYNSYLAPDRDELRALSQREKESFKEYAQRWRELAAQIRPPLEEKELTKLFLNTLSPFYYEKMVASAPNNFTEMVGMGMRLEEGVREGRLVNENAPTNSAKKFGNNFLKKKEPEVGLVAQGRPKGGNYQQHHVAAVTPKTNSEYQPQHQALRQFNNQNHTQKAPQFDPIPMPYAELLPALIDKNLVRTRTPPPVPATLPRWYRSDHFCAFHQGAPDHDIERCYALKAEVQKLIRANILSFKESEPK
ncbi:hypothetical protein QL285_096825 [Trifolium repens]|nr:hypothetical protein QL285_096825 [Trifolium repens]